MVELEAPVQETVMSLESQRAAVDAVMSSTGREVCVEVLVGSVLPELSLDANGTVW